MNVLLASKSHCSLTIVKVELDVLLEKKRFLTFKSIHILIKYMF